MMIFSKFARKFCAFLCFYACFYTVSTAYADAPGQYLAAIVAESDHDARAADFHLRQALQADPSNVSLIQRDLINALAAGDMKQSTALAERAVAHDRGNLLAQLALAVHDFGLRHYASTHAHLGERDFASVLLDSWAYAGEGNARRAFDKLNRVAGSSALTAHYHAALIADHLGDTKEALKQFQALHAANIFRIDFAYAQFLNRHKDIASTKAVDEDYDKSDPAIFKDIQSSHAMCVQEGAAEALYNASVLADEQEHDKLAALIYLRLALALDPHHDFALVALGNLLVDTHRIDEAVDAYLAVPTASPLWRGAHIQAAITYSENSQSDKGLAIMKHVVATYPQDAQAWDALGTLQRAAKDFAAASVSYNKAITLLPTPLKRENWSLFYFAGIAYERTHQWPKAEEVFKTALKLYPDQPQVMNYLAYSWVDQGVNLQDALEMLRRAVDITAPPDGYIVDSLGWAHYKLGHYDEAVHHLERAVSLRPVDPTLNDHLGDAYWRVGRKTEAQFQWSHARDFGPEPEDLPKILQKIKAGLPDLHDLRASL